ncbi:MAG: septum formation initiator family protein [Mycolicibacterium insubricum]|nr:septum formation initiator family protein [Mycobacterium sp.]
MSDGKRPAPKRRSPGSKPGSGGRRPAPGRGRKPATGPEGATPNPSDEEPPVSQWAGPESRAMPEAIAPIRAAYAAATTRANEQRLGFTARRAAILAAVVCVLTLTIAGPVRTFFAQRAEQAQLAATEKALRSQIADLQQQKDKQTDPAYIAAQARARLGFVMPGDVPYQVQLPPSAVVPGAPAGPALPAPSNDPWYTSLWKTIADDPHPPASPPPTVTPDHPGAVPDAPAAPPAGSGG